MKQRKKQPAVTRQMILDAAGEEFTRHGYAGAGIGAIVTKAELTKGALFHHFPDKRTLAIAWIGGVLAEAIRETWIKPLDDIHTLNELRSFCRAGCLGLRDDDATSTLVSLAAETAACDRLLGAACEAVFAAWRAAIAALLERGKVAGWIHRSIQPEVEASMFVANFCGLSVTTKCNPEDAFRRLCTSGLEAYLETLRPE